MNNSISEDILSRVTGIISAEPSSSQALILYALVNTLAYTKSGCLFKLDKLKDLTAENRQLAYALMDIMASDGQAESLFASFKGKMDDIVRGA
jgi:hypothetical protein